MGQYYKVVNIDKKEFLTPHTFGDGAKLMEFGSSGSGTMLALTVLLSSGNGRGGGDIDSNDPLVGFWAGDRIVIAGDYDDGGKFDAEAEGKNLYQTCGDDGDDMVDISLDMLRVLAEDEWTRDSLISSAFLLGDDERGLAIAEALGFFTVEECQAKREELRKKAK
jgi:hypothetical protein